MTTLTIIGAVVLLSLVVHIGLFLWIRARLRQHDRDRANEEH